jgi:pimeloyl-ACP methyl ester carboxylesterase
MDYVVAGHRAHVYTGTKPPDHALPWVVFVHGAAHDHSVFALQSRSFAWHRRNVLAVDLPGHGRSDGAPLASIEAIADWLAALLDAAGAPRASLVGHSMGALAALECAARHPARIERIALLGPSVPMPVSDDLLAAARDDEPLARAMIVAWSLSPTGAMATNPWPGQWMPGGALRLLERARPGTLAIDLAACNAYTNGLAAAAACAAPALCILGTRDQMAPARAAQPLIAALARCEVVTLAGAGHALMSEVPDAVLAALAAFVPAAA